MVLAAALIGILAAGQDAPHSWPDYRGPNLDGHMAADALPPLSWSEQSHVRWKVPVPGRGWSSPILAAGRVWLTTADPDGTRLSLLCFDVESGELLVDRVLFEVPEPAHRNALNSYASPSATVGDGRVFVSFGHEGLVCLNATDAEELWRRSDLPCEHLEGPGSSPLYFAGRLVLHLDGAEQQYVVALDPASGQTLWRTDRDPALLDGVQPDMRKAFATPVPLLVGGQWQLISTAAEATFGLNPRDGEELWRVEHGGFSMSSRALTFEGAVLVNTGFMRPQLWSLQVSNQSADESGSGVVVNWKATRGMPTMASPVIVGERLFTVSDGGVASCLDVRSGELIWKHRLAGEYSASLLYGAGRVYAFDREGTCTVIAADDEFRELAVNVLDDGCMASAAAAGDALIVRTRSHLYRLEESLPRSAKSR